MQILYIGLLFVYFFDPANVENVQTSLIGKSLVYNAKKSIVLEPAGTYL